MRLTLDAVNRELARRGHRVLLAKAGGYFYFWSGEAAGWLDRTVPVARISDLTLDEWIARFLELKHKNEQIFAAPAPKPARGRRARRAS